MAASNSDSVDVYKTKYSHLHGGKCFWDEGQFELVVKRLECGKKSTNDFLFMVKERAVIERDYADKLQNWHSRWTKTVKEGYEFGEVESIWLTVLKEGQRMANVHFSVSSSLGLSENEGLQGRMYQFKHANYHKVPILKELREAREQREIFRNAQAAYRKSIDIINKHKKKYEEMVKTVQQIVNRKKEKEVTAADSSKPTTKTESTLKTKLETQTEQRDKAKAKYLEAINYFNDNVKDTYVNDMNKEFQKSQDFELKRITMLLNSLHDFMSAVNVQTQLKQPISTFYADISAPLAVANPDRNLIYFAKNFGPLMAPNFPKFEDLDAIGRPSIFESSNKDQTERNVSMILPNFAQTLLHGKKHHMKSESDLALPAGTSVRDFMLRRPSNFGSVNRSLNKSSDTALKQHQSFQSFDSVLVSTPYESLADLSNSSKEHFVMSNIYVKAVTDFAGTHKDYLQFKRGEIIYQLRGDEKGWCHGRIACREGIYPSKAVQLLKMNLFAF